MTRSGHTDVDVTQCPFAFNILYRRSREWSFSDHSFYFTIFVVEEDDASVFEVAVKPWSQCIKEDFKETRQSSPDTTQIVCESR